MPDSIGIPLVYDVKERCEVAVILTVRIHSVIDSYEPHISIRKFDLRVHSDLKIIPSETAHILNNDGCYISAIDLCD